MAPPAADELRAIRDRVDTWQISTGGWRAIEPGLLRSYRRGRSAYKCVCAADRSLQQMHEWRKRVKDLTYHERLLSPACGPATAGHAKDAERLSEMLGEHHDLGMLRDAVCELVVPVDRDALLALLDHRRHALQAEIMWIGARVYAESPKAFAARVRSCWKAGRAAARAVRHQRPAELARATRAARGQ